jgi:type VI secretion system secreted protein VgrG
LAARHEAQSVSEHQQPLGKALDGQNNELRGGGKRHGEFTTPHILVSSPSGIAATAAASTHLHSGDHTSVTAGGHISLAGGKSFVATALERVSLFAHSMGMKLFAGKGKVEIQAQSDDLDVIADQVLQIISAKGPVNISAPKEILLTAGGSYIKINGSGIEQGTPGEWVVYAAGQDTAGARTMPFATLTSPTAAPFYIYDEQIQAYDQSMGGTLAGVPYFIERADGVVFCGVTDENGKCPRISSESSMDLKVWFGLAAEQKRSEAGL